MSSPWVVYGQTVLNPVVEGIDNPTPNTAGLIGEIDALPYRVPDGRKLVITAYGFEGHTMPHKVIPVFVLVPWLSDEPMPNATGAERAVRQLCSCSASTHTNVVYCHQEIPSGKYVNVRILNDGSAMRHGWFMQGELVEVA